MKRRVVVVSSCAPPLEGHPVTGGGLRTQQLVSTLEEAGHQVFLMIEAAALPEDAPQALLRKAFDVEDVLEEVRSRRPSVVVVEQWALAARLAELDKPIVIDLHGSLMLENVYRRGEIDLTLDAGAKIQALRGADLLMAPSEAQLRWFGSWAAIAGFDPREPPLALLPLAMPGDPPAERTEAEPYLRLVYGGARWPWIDSHDALEVAARVAEEAYGGRLDVFVFEPPRHGLPVDEELGTWPQAEAMLRGRTKKGVRFREPLPHADFSNFLRKKATVALDLWKPNPERMLAATTRTVEYLWAGLPVITIEGASWAETLLATGAGWTVPADDPDALEALLKGLAEEPARIAAASAAATKLARERLTTVAAGRALIDFVAKPSCPPRTAESLTGAVIAEREAHFAVALQEQHAHMLTAHEGRADQLRRSHMEEVRELTARHRAVVDDVTERHRKLVEELTDKHRADQAEIIVERQRETGKMVAYWQGELDNVRKELAGSEARYREALDEAEVRHRGQLEALEERWREQVAQEADRAKEELREARDERRQELAHVETGRAGALAEAQERHRTEIASLVEEQRAALKALETERKAERKALESERDRELSDQSERHRAAMDEVEVERRAERKAVEASLAEAAVRHREQMEAAVGERVAELRREQERHRAELEAVLAEHRQAAQEQRKHGEALVEQHRVEMEGARGEREAEVQRVVGQWQAELAQADGQRTAEMEAADARHRQEIEAAVAEWQGRLDETEQGLAAARTELAADRDRAREERHRHREEVVRLEVELNGAASRLEEARSTIEQLEQRWRVRVPKLPGRVGKAARLAKLWVGHAMDREE